MLLLVLHAGEQEVITIPFMRQQMGFDELMQMVPSLAQQRNMKISKATVLQKSKSCCAS